MSYTAEEIETALEFNKVGYEQKTGEGIKKFRKELDRKTTLLVNFFNALEDDYKNHSKKQNPFSNPAIRETEDGITYFEYDVDLGSKKYPHQIEICQSGYFVNEPSETFLPDDIALSGNQTRGEQTKTLFCSDPSITTQILRGYAECMLAGPMTAIENRVFEKLNIKDGFLGIKMDQRPESIIEYIENSEKNWETFVHACRKSPHASLFVR